MSDIYPELFNWFNLDLQDNTKTLNTDFYESDSGDKKKNWNKYKKSTSTNNNTKYLRKSLVTIK